ncbi:MAG: ATP-binding region ATPase domain protein [Mucilaginibacter sp.]|nr:ATP-binding region ATPase domain protein [Mucilaginibacter sp.]
MKTKQPWYAVLLILLCSITVFGSPSYNTIQPVAKNGIIDLRKQSFIDEIELSGQWNFYWQQLIDPQKATTTKAELINFPSLWNNHITNGKKLPAFGYASYIDCIAA